MELERGRKRRRYSSQLKAEILFECEASRASVAKVAMSRGINANILYGWRKLTRQSRSGLRSSTPNQQFRLIWAYTAN